MSIGSLIGAGAQAVGTIGSLIGGRKDKKHAENSALKSWQRNYEAQKEFAQNSIQWRVQDAKHAGINPYAVVGGQSAGYTPQDTSYQTSYQQGVSQAMNGLADAMGQLQMASVQEEVRGKKLDNEAKKLELINKSIETRLGQLSQTIKPPLSAVHTNPVKDVDGMKIQTDADGSQWFKASADDMDPWNVQNVRDIMTALYSPHQYEALQTANKGKGKQALFATGRAYYPEGTKPDRPNVRAAEIARDYGTLTGWLSLPSLWLREGIDNLLKPRKKR